MAAEAPSRRRLAPATCGVTGNAGLAPHDAVSRTCQAAYTRARARLVRDRRVPCFGGGKPMSNDLERGELVVKCECGFEARGQQAELVSQVQQHGRDAHNMDATPEQVLA